MTWPWESLPHETMDPSERSAREWLPPPATCEKLVPGGVLMTWPWESLPHETMDPSERSAREWLLPPAT
jgi:hypothetical protein